MAIFSIRELIDLIVMTAALGYIFMHYIPKPRTQYHFVESGGFAWDDFKFAVYVTAPAIVLHELMHKFIGLMLGISDAVFHASYFGLSLGIFLRIISSPFMIFVPGYVSLGGGSNLALALTAFAGPATNLLLFLAAGFILDRKRSLTKNQALILYLTKQINLFLFIFNMLPLPPFDGSKVFYYFFKALF